MAFVVKQVAEHGVSNPIVARLSLRTLEIMKKATLDDAKEKALGDLYLETLQPKLLRCWEIRERFRTEFNEKADRYEAPKPGARAVEVPQVMRLREECHNFLYESKNYLRGVLKVMNVLYGTQFDEASEFVRARERTRYALIQMRTAASLMAARKLSGLRS